MAMCCVEAAVGILHPGRPLQLATGGDRNERFSPFFFAVVYLWCRTVVVSLLILLDTATPVLAGADSLWRPPDLFINRFGILMSVRDSKLR